MACILLLPAADMQESAAAAAAAATPCRLVAINVLIELVIGEPQPWLLQVIVMHVTAAAVHSMLHVPYRTPLQLQTLVHQCMYPHACPLSC
jgi:hypothetical protein